MDQKMTDEQRDIFKEELLKEQQNLQQELDAVSTPDKGEHVPGERAATFPDYGDDNLGENTSSPAEVAQYMQNVDATGRLEQRKREVNAALKRLDSGAYGVCVVCAIAIPLDRMKANPAADKCINCAKKHNA